MRSKGVEIKAERCRDTIVGEEIQEVTQQGSWRTVKTAPRDGGQAVPGFFPEGENPGNLTEKACADIHEGGKGSKTGCHAVVLPGSQDKVPRQPKQLPED